MNKLLLLTVLLAFLGCSKSENQDEIIETSQYNDSQEIDGLTYYTKLSENNAVLDIKKEDLNIEAISWPIEGGTLQTFNSFGESVNKKIEGVYIQDYKIIGDNIYILINYLDNTEQKFGIHDLLQIKNNKLVKKSFFKKQITDHSGIPYQLKEWYDGSIIISNNPTVNPNERDCFFQLLDNKLNLLLIDQKGLPIGEYIVDMYRELIFSESSFSPRIALIYSDIRENKPLWVYEIYKGDMPVKIINKELHYKDNKVIGNIQYVLENGDKSSKDLKIDINTGEDL